MPRSVESHDISKMVLNAVQELVLEGGIEAASYRRVAERADVTLAMLRSRWPTHGLLLRSAAWGVQERLLYRMPRATPAGDRRSWAWEVLVSQLPFEEETRRLTTVWLAYIARARHVDDEVRRAVEQAHFSREAMCRTVLRSWDVPAEQVPAEALRLLLLLDGIRVTLCDPTGGLPVERAEEVLRRHLASVAG